MLPYTANEIVEATLRQVYGPAEATRRSLHAAVWTDSGDSDSILSRAVERTRHFAARIAALAL